MHRTSRTIARAVLLLVAVVAFVGLPAVPAGSAPAQAGHKATWTVLMYMDADTTPIEGDLLHDDLESFATTDPGDQVNRIALVDRIPGQDDGPLLNLPDFDTAKLLKLENGQFTELKDLGEVDMGDGQTLAWFVATGMTQFPADHYALFINDHGGGITGTAWDDSTPPVDGRDSNLSVTEVARAIPAGMQAAGVDHLDLLSFSSCLMATYDVAAKMAPFADYMVASEEVSMGPQWRMDGMMNALRANPDASAPDLAETFVDNTDKAGLLNPSRTMSVLDLHAVDRLGQALNSFAMAVSRDIKTSGAALGHAQNETLHFGTEGSRLDHKHLYDIGDLLAHLEGVSPDVETARNALYEALKRTVVSQAVGEGTSTATGLSIYFPPSADDYFTNYPQFAATSSWAQLLEAYFKVAGTSSGPGNGASPAFTSSQAQVKLDATGVVASATLAPGTEAAVSTTWFNGAAVLPDGTIQVLVSSPAILDAGGPSQLAQGWDFSKLQLTDGTTTLDATVTFETAGGSLVGSVPIVYGTADGTQTNADLLFLMGADGTLKGSFQLFQLADNGSVSQIDPAAGSIIAPLAFVVPPGGQPHTTLLSNQTIDASTLQLTASRLPSGTAFLVQLEADDAAGNAAIAGAKGTVP